MSTTSAPRGLKPIGLLGGMPFAGSTMEISIDSGYATAIFNGDVVGYADVTNSTDDGHLVRESAASEVNPIGVFLGCSYTDPNTGQPTHRQYYPGVSDGDYIPDGGVRVYGTWHYNHKATGKVLETKYYGVFQFNEEGKIAYDLEWFDLGGIFAQLEE